MKEVLLKPCGDIVTFKVANLHFISLEDIKLFLSLNKNFTFEDVKLWCTLIGRPQIVNMEKTIENNYKIVYYEEEEILWKCPKNCEECGLNEVRE